jgi:Tfp pilus assembly protein PilW
MAAILTTLQAGQQMVLFGSGQVDAQASARLAIDRMSRDIRLAGYDPTGNGAFTAIASQTSTGFALQYDWDGDNTITTAAPALGPDGMLRGERVTYSVASGELLRQESGIDTVPIVVSRVQVAGFMYLDAAGAGTNVSASIRSIRVTVTTRSGGAGPLTLGNVSTTVTDTVRLRNRVN